MFSEHSSASRLAYTLFKYWSPDKVVNILKAILTPSRHISCARAAAEQRKKASAPREKLASWMIVNGGRRISATQSVRVCA